MAKVKHARSSKTGKYVTKEFAEQNPDTTVVETDKKKRIPRKKKKKLNKEMG